jgi:uncharacterized membrane protein
MASDQVASNPSETRYDRDQAEFGRATGFFDATFAIATTLLAITLSPGAEGWSSWSSLVESMDGPLLAFAISFTVIASYWWANHQFVASLELLSPRLIVGTVILLAFVVLLPITTEGLGQEGGSTEVTTVVYAVNVAIVSSTEWILYRIAVGQRLFVTQPSRVDVQTNTVTQLLVPVVFLASVPVAMLGAPGTARWMWATLLVLSPIAGRWANGRMSPAPARVG